MEVIISNSYKFKRKKMGRIGIIDVGSNSVRLVVFDGISRSPAYFFNEKVLCGLGRGIGETKKLNLVGKRKTIQAVKRFITITEKMNLTELVGVATAAVRNSIDGIEFIKKLNKDTGLNLHVASGKEEAKFSANGVILGWPDAKGIVCDIGGGSLELANVGRGEVGLCATSQLGPLVLAGFKGSDLDLKDFIGKEVKKLCSKFKPFSQNLYLVGGSFRVFARIDMALSKYPLRVLHEYKITANQAL
jgi:exopolyphosphatase/guanosine-5'-triphosphate,3'-diphosphate pyrophosphatase